MKKNFLLLFFMGIMFSQDAIQVSPSTLNFGNVLMGNSPTQTFTITCNLDQSITITPPSYYSVDMSDLSMVSGQTQNIIVTFNPPQVGNFDSQIVLAGSTFGNAVVNVNATVTNNLSGSVSGTLTSQFSPYEVSDDLIVEDGNTWNIEAGTELRFAFGKKLVVNGLLSIQGTYDNLVTMVAEHPDSGWAGIKIENSNGSDLEYLSLKHVTNSDSKRDYIVFEDFEDNIDDINFSDDIIEDQNILSRKVGYKSISSDDGYVKILSIPKSVHNGEPHIFDLVFKANQDYSDDYNYGFYVYTGTSTSENSTDITNNGEYIEITKKQLYNNENYFSTSLRVEQSTNSSYSDGDLVLYLFNNIGSSESQQIDVYIDQVGVYSESNRGYSSGLLDFDTPLSVFPGTYITSGDETMSSSYMQLNGIMYNYVKYFTPEFEVYDVPNLDVSFDIKGVDDFSGTFYLHAHKSNGEEVFQRSYSQSVFGNKINILNDLSFPDDGKFYFKFVLYSDYSHGGVIIDNFLVNGGNVTGALSLNNSQNINIKNSRFSHSTNGISLNNSNLIFKNNVIYNNDYLGKKKKNSDGMALNSIIWSNNLDIIASSSTNFSIDYSIFSSNQGSVSLGSNNINTYPNLELETFTLNPLSPAIDAGHPSDYDDCQPPGAGSLLADIGMFGGMDNCGSQESNLGGGEPAITIIEDMPQDQGGYVGIQFSGSLYDTESDVHNVTHYSIWRELDTNGSSSIEAHTIPDGMYFILDNRNSNAWEYIGDSPAQEFDNYGYTAPTIADSNHNGLFWSKFLVVAHTSDESIYFVSEPDSGYSVDNINPDPVENLNMNFYGNYNQITWDIPTNEDYLYTKIIRDDELVSEIYENVYFSDFELDFSTKYSYKIIHVDENGNESVPNERDIEIPDWVIHLETQSDMQGVSNSNFYFAAHDSATIGFDEYYDIFSPPSPPGDYLRLVSRQDYNNQLIDYSYISVDPVDLSSFTRSVEIDATSNGINDPDGVNDQILVNAYLYGLSDVDFNISIDGAEYYTPHTIDSNEVITKQFSMYFNDNDSTHLELVLGNQGLGQPSFANFNDVEIYHGGLQEVFLNTDGINNGVLKIEFLAPFSERIVDTLGVYSNLNSILDTLSIDFFENSSNDFHMLRKKGYIENARLILDYTYGSYDYSITSSEFTVLSDTITHHHHGDWDMIHPYYGGTNIRELIEASTDLSYSAYSLNEENLSYEIINFSDINSKPATSFWLKVNDLDSTETVELDFYGTSPEINSTMSKTIYNNSSWVMIGSSVRPIIKDSIRLTLYHHELETEKSWQEAVSDSIIVNRLYGLDAYGNYSNDSITNVTKGFWIGFLNTLVEYDSIRLHFPLHSIPDNINANQSFEYGIIINGLSMGFSASASSGKDFNDEVSPPNIPTNEVFVKLYHPEWEFSLGDDFLTDIRNQSNLEYEEFPVKFFNDGEIKLNTKIINIPNDWSAILLYQGSQIILSEVEEAIINVENGDLATIVIGNLEELSNDIKNNIPLHFTLHQNYPNPFNPTTQIRYDLPQDALVSISIYDVMGRMIKSLSNANQTAGYHSLQWDATNDMGESVSAGMYIYTIQAGEYRSTKKMVLLK